MAQGFIKKNWQKDAGDVLLESAVRAVGGFGTAFISNKVFTVKKNDKGEENKMLYNIGGPIMTAVGILGDMMVADPKVKAFFQGVSTVGMLRSIAVIGDKSIAPKIALAGVEEEEIATEEEQQAQLFSGVGAALGETSAVDPENYSGDEMPADVAQLMQGETTVQDTDGKTYNNDWAYLAENIDNAEQITKSVNGVEQSAAELMGTEDEDEAALLMGMFS